MTPRARAQAAKLIELIERHAGNVRQIADALGSSTAQVYRLFRVLPALRKRADALRQGRRGRPRSVDREGEAGGLRGEAGIPQTPAKSSDGKSST